MKSRNELIQQLDNAFHLSAKPAIRKLRDDHIEDPDRSVNWNRQFVIYNNIKYNEEFDRLRTAREAKISKAVDDIVDIYIMDNLDFDTTFAGARAIYNWSYQDGHPNGAYGIFDEIDHNIEFLNYMYSLSPDFLKNRGVVN